MREIKFRAWSKRDNCYLKSFAIFYNGEFSDMAKGVMHGSICQCDINYQPIPNDIIIEQYTGLKDKNGVEIYEGDIVKQNGDWEDCYNYEIIFGKIGFDGAWNGLMGFALKRENKYSDFNELYYHDEPYNLEVIGNIHEEVE